MRIALLVAIIMFFTWLAIGTYSYHEIEGFSYLDAFYFSGVTILSVGCYGDLIPVTPIGKIFTIFFALFGVATVWYIVLTGFSIILESQKKFLENKLHGYVTKMGYKQRYRFDSKKKRFGLF